MEEGPWKVSAPRTRIYAHHHDIQWIALFHFDTFDLATCHPDLFHCRVSSILHDHLCCDLFYHTLSIYFRDQHLHKWHHDRRDLGRFQENVEGEEVQFL